MRKTLLPALALCTALYGVQSIKSAEAAGFYLQEQSVSGLGTAYAGAASTARDASVLYYNPAGITQLKGFNVNAGAHVLVPRANLNDTGSTLFGPAITGVDSDDPVGVTALPNLFATKQVTDDFWLGVGVTFPFGLGSEYDDNWFGRYDSIKSDLSTVNIQPTMAYRVNDWLSFGASVDVQYVDVELTAAVNDGAEGLRTLEGETTSFGYTAGLTATPWAGTDIGISYRSTVNHEVEGRLKVEGTAGSDVNIAATAQLSTPDIASFGITQALNDKWKVMVQANWFGWNNFEEITVRNIAGGVVSGTTQNYQTTWAYSVGAEYQMDEKWTLRAGYQFDETPTTDEYRTTLTPDGDRHWITAGGTYQWDEDWSIDFAAAYIDIGNEEINVSRNSGTASVQADSEGSVGIFSLGVNYKF